MIKELIQHLKQSPKKELNFKKWQLWAEKVLRRKNITIDLSICAYGKDHLIKKVQPFGGGYVFWSVACGGCLIGKMTLKAHKEHKSIPIYTHCKFLQSGLLTRDQVKPGDIYTLPEIAKIDIEF